MSDLETKNNDSDGKKVLGGVKILLWVVSIISGLGMLTFNSWTRMFEKVYTWIPGFPFEINTGDFRSSIIFTALFVVALVGIYMRKGWAVPVGRAALVVTMVIFFPVGTIFGAVLWKRINDPAAKKYLNYNEEKNDKNKEEDAGKKEGSKEEEIGK